MDTTSTEKRTLADLIKAGSVPEQGTLSDVQREQWANEGRRFRLHEAAHTSTKWTEDAWEFKLSSDGRSFRTLMPNKNEVNEYYSAIAVALLDGPIDDCVFVIKSRNYTKPFIMIEAAG